MQFHSVSDPVAVLESVENPGVENMFLFPDEPQGSETVDNLNDENGDSTAVQMTSSGHPNMHGAQKCASDRPEKVLVNISPTESLEGGLDTMTTSEFLVIDSPFIRKNSVEEDCAILTLSRDDLTYMENHFERPTNGKRDMLKPAPFLPEPVDRYHIQEFNVSWKLFGGLDFPSL